MITYGQYELVDELYRTEFGLVGTVRPLDGSDLGDRIIKVFDPTVGDERARAVEARSFLERARLQKALIKQGAKHWQQVYEVAAASRPGVAYYTADYHPLSAQKLVDGRVEISAAALANIIRGTIDGLRELKTLRGRPHGDLKPSNVLVVGSGDLRRAKIVLCDPAAPSLAASNGEHGDLFAIGALIHELVLHRRFDAGTIWPLAPDPGWDRLGRTGKSWWSLCNDLLSPTPRRALASLKRLSRTVETIAPRRRIAGRPVQMAALVLLLALAAGAYAVVGHHEQQLVCSAQQGWLSNFAASLKDPPRHARYLADPSLADVVHHVEQLDSSSLHCDSDSSGWLLSPSQFQATRQAASNIRSIEDDLRPAHWDRLRLVIARQREFDARAWQQPAHFVLQIVKSAQPAANQSLAADVDRVLDLDDALIRTSPDADAAWGRLDAACKSLEQTGDVLLIACSQSIRTSAVAAPTLDVHGLHGIDQLNDLAGLGTRLAGALEDSKSGKINFTRFAADFGKQVPAGSMTTAAIRTWVDKLGAYSISQDKIEQAIGELHIKMDGVTSDVLSSGPPRADLSLFDADKSKVEEKIEQFRQTPFTGVDIEAGELAKAEKAIDGDIEKLLQYRRPKSPLAWIRELPAMETSSDHVNEYWQSWKRVLPNRLPENDTDNATFDIVKKETDRLWNALRDLDAALAQPPAAFDAGDRTAAFVSAAKQRREDVLASILHEFKPGPQGFDQDAWKKAGADYAEWLKNLAALARDFPVRSTLLSVDDRPDLRWAQVHEAFWKDPVIQNLVAPDMLRIRRLQSMKSQGRDALARAAQEEPTTEVVLAAWKELGSARIDPPWPSKQGELDAEAKIRRKLADDLKTAAPADRAPAEEALQQQSAIRWRLAVENADAPQTLGSALELRKIFAIDATEYRKLSAEARFNLALFVVRQQLRRSSGDANDTSLKDLIDALKQSVNELKGQYGTSDLLFKLAGLNQAESFAGDEHGDYFRPQIFGASMEFKLVTFGDIRPFYLSTREVSLDDFLRVMSAAKLWKNARSIPLGQPTNTPDALPRGPRVWEWTGPTTAAAPPPPILLTEFWLAGGERGNDFPLELRASKFNRSALSDDAGGNPSADHPMQQISAQAALYFASACGCRLPTTREWQGAYNLFEKDVATERWNLRDQTWLSYQRYAQTLASPQSRLADNGIFIPPGATVASGAAAKANSKDDHTLFFRKVSGDGEAGGTFKHLVGNVAEFVNDAPGQFDQAMDVLAVGVTNDAGAEAGRAQRIAKFAAAAKDRLGVIGGSALSPPEIPVDKAQRLSRTDVGFADVGLRLAFTAPAKDLADRLRWVLEEQPYLWRASLADGKDKPAGAASAAESRNVAGQ